jgi:DNA-binding HxlR family transcriptional regulator
MRWDELSEQPCSMSRSLAVLGDRWTFLILRDCFLKVRRFDDFHESLGVARRVLTERLNTLVASGVLRKVSYQENPERFEYRLTDMGLELYPVILSMVHWGDKYFSGTDGPPIIHSHKSCGHDFKSVITCSVCGEKVGANDVIVRSGEALLG